MFGIRVLIVVGLLSIGSSVRAQNYQQDDQGRMGADQGRIGADVYATTACQIPNCFMNSTGLGYPNPVPYTDFATLTLPPGNYLLNGKLSAYTNSPLNYGNLECYMGTLNDVPSDWWNFTDYSSVAYSSGGQQHVVSMVLAVKVTAPRTMHIGCKLAGFYYDSQNQQLSIQLGVWGVRLIAERVGHVSQSIVP